MYFELWASGGPVSTIVPGSSGLARHETGPRARAWAAGRARGLARHGPTWDWAGLGMARLRAGQAGLVLGPGRAARIAIYICDFQAWYRALDCSKWQVLLPTFVFVYGCVYGENDRKKFDSRGSPWSYTCEMLSYVSKGTIEISFYSLTFPWEWKTNCDKLLGFFFDMHV